MLPISLLSHCNQKLLTRNIPPSAKNAITRNSIFPFFESKAFRSGYLNILSNVHWSSPTNGLFNRLQSNDPLECEQFDDLLQSDVKAVYSPELLVLNRFEHLSPILAIHRQTPSLYLTVSTNFDTAASTRRCSICSAGWPSSDRSEVITFKRLPSSMITFPNWTNEISTSDLDKANIFFKKQFRLFSGQDSL